MQLTWFDTRLNKHANVTYSKYILAAITKKIFEDFAVDALYDLEINLRGKIAHAWDQPKMLPFLGAYKNLIKLR